MLGQARKWRSAPKGNARHVRLNCDILRIQVARATEREEYGGETGIRTLGGLAPTTVFETAPFDHSGTSPRGSVREPFNESRGGVQGAFPQF